MIDSMTWIWLVLAWALVIGLWLVRLPHRIRFIRDGGHWDLSGPARNARLKRLAVIGARAASHVCTMIFATLPTAPEMPALSAAMAVFIGIGCLPMIVDCRCWSELNG